MITRSHKNSCINKKYCYFYEYDCYKEQLRHQKYTYLKYFFLNRQQFIIICIYINILDWINFIIKVRLNKKCYELITSVN